MLSFDFEHKMILNLMVVGWQSKIILHTQPIKIFRIATSINAFNLCGSLEYFDWLSAQNCFWLSTHHH